MAEGARGRPADADEAVAELVGGLGLGPLIPGSVRDLKPGDRNPVWAFDTFGTASDTAPDNRHGRWVVKTAHAPGEWWYDEARRAAVLERAAVVGGVRVPRAVAPNAGADTVGLWTRGGDRSYFRVMERIEGANPGPEPIPAALARWAGETLAVLEAVAPRVEGDWSATGYATHPIADWRQWLGEGRALGLLSDAERSEALALVTVLNAGIENAASGAPELRLLHRDVSRFNILLSPDGPVLIDFDHAGPQHPWWEAVCHVFHLASPQHGVLAPDRRVVEAALDAYRAAGGVGGPATVEAFAGMAAARLSFAAWLLWNACGHRGGDEAWQRKCGVDFRTGFTALRSLQESAGLWAAWLS